MTNKNIANSLVLILVVCTLSSVYEVSDNIFSLLGIAIAILSWMAFKRLYNEHRTVAQWFLGFTISLFLSGFIDSQMISDISAVGFWVFAILAIVKLYKLK